MYLQAQTPAEIDEIRDMTVNWADTDADDNWVTKKSPLVSTQVRAMVDMMCFCGAYCHKSMLESPTRTRLAFRTSFQEYALLIAHERVDEFYSSWKDYRARNPVGDRRPKTTVDGPVDIDAMLGGDDDDAAAAAGAATPAAAQAAAPAAASAEDNAD